MALNIEAVKDMLTAVTPLTPESPVSDALQAMFDASTNVLPVCEPGGKLLGLVVRSDLLPVRDPGTPVGPLRRVLEPLTLNSTAQEVAAVMRRERLREVAISDADGNALGMFDAFLLSLL